MSFTKAVLLTLLIFIIEAGIVLTSLFVFDSKNAHLHGISVIIARVVAYSTVFILFWRGNDQKGIFQFSKLCSGKVLCRARLYICLDTLMLYKFEETILSK